MIEIVFLIPIFSLSLYFYYQRTKPSPEIQLHQNINSFYKCALMIKNKRPYNMIINNFITIYNSKHIPCYDGVMNGCAVQYDFNPKNDKFKQYIPKDGSYFFYLYTKGYLNPDTNAAKLVYNDALKYDTYFVVETIYSEYYPLSLLKEIHVVHMTPMFEVNKE